MGRETLLEALRTQAVADKARLWDEARAGAQSHRAELARALEEERTRQVAAAEASARRLEEEALAGARHRARELRTRAAITLAERCRGLAEAELTRLRAEGGTPLFRALAGELPARPWSRVRVHPDDLEIARELFAGAEVVAERGISGGMEVEAEDGRIRISNTLETRLATAWPDILPGLVRELLPDGGDERPAA